MPTPMDKIGFKVNPDMATDDPATRQKILDGFSEVRRKSAWDRFCAEGERKNKRIETADEINFYVCLMLAVLIVVCVVWGIAKTIWG